MRDLKVPKVRGVRERLLPEPLRAEAGVSQKQGKLEAQENHVVLGCIRRPGLDI